MALRVLIFGAPGCGKGTISKYLVSDFGFTHVAAGDLLRSRRQSNDDFAKELSAIIDKGLLIPDTTISKIIKDEMAKFEKSNPIFLLDGYPRNIAQVKLLEMAGKTDLAINIEVPFQTIISRLSDRLVHEPSGRTYNLKWNPPKVEGIDDVTGDKLTRRPDDDEKVIARRLKIYEETLEPVINHYRNLNVLKSFRGEESRVIYKELKPFMEDFLRNYKN